MRSASTPGKALVSRNFSWPKVIILFEGGGSDRPDTARTGSSHGVARGRRELVFDHRKRVGIESRESGSGCRAAGAEQKDSNLEIAGRHAEAASRCRGCGGSVGARRGVERRAGDAVPLREIHLEVAITGNRGAYSIGCLA